MSENTTQVAQVGLNTKKVVTRRFPTSSPYDMRVLGTLVYQCQGCDFMSFLGREAYGHHLTTGHWLEEREEVSDGKENH
jgi:hypothetical protein